MKKQTKISEKDKRKGFYQVLIVATLLFLLFGWMFIRHQNKQHEIDKNYASTMGIIIKNEIEAKGDWGVSIKYKVKNKCYIRNFSSTTWCQEGSCIGDTVKIEYSSKDPNIVRLVRNNDKIQYPSFKLGEQDYTIDCDKYK